MKCHEIRELGPVAYHPAERPDPEAGPGEVVVAMQAASLNFRDLLMVRGHYNPRLPLPRIPLSDGAGEVVAVGAGVEGLAVGDRVASCFFQRWPAGRPTVAAAQSALGGEVDGVLAERVALRADGVVPIPAGVSYAEAATLPCAAVTAWNALFSQPIAPGDTVLVLGSGGVSVFALQLAKAAGARVIATSSSDAKLERLRELGASDGVNYATTPDWHKAVLDLTGGQGVDRVIEVGGAGTLAKSVKATRIGGHVSLIGVLAGAGDFDPIQVLMKAITVQGIFVGPREMHADLHRFWALHGLKPAIDRTFGWDEGTAALEHMASGAHFGKIVLAA
jgi:NADPH:quinone reductase-like Zn-dependent oxidoreductase